MGTTTAEITSVIDLMSKNLTIPAYQRPYKWSTKNIDDLLNDISSAIKESIKYEDFSYRIGTIILHKDGEELKIVDGQQRIISFALILKNLEPNLKKLKPDFICSILENDFQNKITQKNIHDNYKHIDEWFSYANDIEREKIIKAFDELLQVVIITVSEDSEAFQLFDSQNTRGKGLNPHDLLKAYHLREMKDYPYEMRHAVKKWESKDSKKIKDLFNIYLFAIWNWCRVDKTKTFTDKDISAFKGISQSSPYYYARRTGNAMPYFQITEPFISGNDFFEMVDHYLMLKSDVETEIDNNEDFAIIKNILKTEEYKNNKGFNYSKDLFYCALLCYYDKFHNFDPMAVKKLFVWAFMIRIDMDHLGFDTINKYAIGGEDNSNYTNKYKMFSIIYRARMHTEISCLTIDTRKDKDWKKLRTMLEQINNKEVKYDE